MEQGEYDDAVTQARELLDPGGVRAAREAALDQAYPDRARKREWRKVARWDGKTCGECGQDLPPGRAYLYNESGRGFLGGRSVGNPYPVCPGCATYRESGTRSDGSTWVSDWAHYDSHGVGMSWGAWHEEPCGGCDRPLYVGVHRRRGVHFYCSEVCRHEGRRKREREARAVSSEVHHPTCTVCGQTFTAARSDAKTCSNACRQKAYRDRQD
jgi:hypothetical protein